MKDYLLSEIKNLCREAIDCFHCEAYEVCKAFDRKESPCSFHIEHPRRAVNRMEVEQC